MKCPRCESANMDERERAGLTIDVCQVCRGVWLDRGELEKLLAHAQRELEEERAYYGASSRGEHDREPPSSSRGHKSDDDPRRYTKRGWLHNLGEIFD